MIGGRAGNSYVPEALGRDAIRQRLPSSAAIRGFEDAAAGPVGRRVDTPGWTTRIPQSRVNDLRILRINREVNCADVVVLEQHLLPRRSAIARAIDSSVGIRAIGMT